MLDRLELLRWGCADAKGWGVGSFEFGVILFEVLEFAEKGVEFSVREGRSAEDVVVVVRAVEGFAQCGGAIYWILRCGQSRRVVIWMYGYGAILATAIPCSGYLVAAPVVQAIESVCLYFRCGAG